ncbi:uncharacterized protein J3R85_015394 [Psidium guajava]|nr:uncharacterized protein J3R85_015394 [Psidium guajava]
MKAAEGINDFKDFCLNARTTRGRVNWGGREKGHRLCVNFVLAMMGRVGSDGVNAGRIASHGPESDPHLQIRVVILSEVGPANEVRLAPTILDKLGLRDTIRQTETSMCNHTLFFVWVNLHL